MQLLQQKNSNIDSNNWTKDITEWKRTKQRRSLSEDIKKIPGPLWHKTTLTRVGWNELEEALVSQRHANNTQQLTSILSIWPS